MFLRSTLILCSATLAACDQPATDTPSSAVEATDPVAADTQTSQPTALDRKPSPEGATVYVVSPTGGAALENPVRVVFGLKGAGVAPAGSDLPDTGHHHLLVDADLPPLNLPIPADDRHIHFGGGQTETVLTLSPGTHTLQLLLGDFIHIPHDPPLMSERVTIEVQQ